ncbi:MAG: TRAP transporter small permease [Paracoccaceae bacterium]
MNRLVEFFVDLLAWLALGFIAGAAMVTGTDVIMRHLLGANIRGVTDLVELAMMCAVFLSIAYAFARRGHVAVTVLTETMSDRTNTVLAFVWWLVAAVVMATLAYATFDQAKMVISYGDSSQNLRIPMFWYWLPVVVGLALSALASLYACMITARDGANDITEGRE